MISRVLIALVLVLAGCSGRPGLLLPNLKPYKIDIQQGNYVTQEMMARVKPGMSSSQVRFALGTPLIIDPFHKDRWDYVYLYQKEGKVTEHRRIIVVFKDDKLVRIEGDVVAAPAKPDSAAKGPAAQNSAAKGGPAAQKETPKAAP